MGRLQRCAFNLDQQRSKPKIQPSLALWESLTLHGLKRLDSHTLALRSRPKRLMRRRARSSGAQNRLACSRHSA